MISTVERSDLRAVLDAMLEPCAAKPTREPFLAAAPVDEALWRRLGSSELGVLGLHVPERFGGAGHGLVDFAEVISQVGATLATVPVLSSAVLATTALLASGNADACSRYLPDIVNGTVRGSVAVYEDGRDWDLTPMSTHADRTDGQWRVTGTKAWVLDGATASFFLVSALTEDGWAVFAVDGGDPGVSVNSVRSFDQTRPLAAVTFASASAALLADPTQAANCLARTMRAGCLALAVSQCALAERSMRMAVEYAKTRVQFGRPIGSYQAIKHRCADMLIAVEIAQSTADYGLRVFDEGDADLPIATHLAKAVCSQAAYEVATANVQVHGGIGFTWEYPAHLYLKRAKADYILFGDPRRHRTQLAAHLGLA